MIISQEVENMCPVAQGVHHGAAPVPTEGKWVKNKEVKDISGLTQAGDIGVPVRLKRKKVIVLFRLQNAHIQS